MIRGPVCLVWARPNRFFPMILVGLFSEFEDAIAFGREASYTAEGTLVEWKQLG